MSHLFNNEVKSSSSSNGYGYTYQKPDIPFDLPTTTAAPTCPPGFELDRYGNCKQVCPSGTVLQDNGECKSDGYHYDKPAIPFPPPTRPQTTYIP